MQTLEELSRVQVIGGQVVRPKVKYLPSEHQTYKVNGKKVVGASTVAGRDPDGKQTLIGWANKLGLQGIDANAFLIHSANIGTMAHKKVELDIRGDIEAILPSGYFEHEHFDIYHHYSDIALEKWVRWWDDHSFTPVHTEMPLVNYNAMYGGTIDIYGELNGKRVLIDLKTSGSVYKSHRLQVAGYYELLKANYYPVDEVCILQTSRDAGVPYHFEKIEKLDKLYDDFRRLLDCYYNEKEYK